MSKGKHAITWHALVAKDTGAGIVDFLIMMMEIRYMIICKMIKMENICGHIQQERIALLARKSIVKQGKSTTLNATVAKSIFAFIARMWEKEPSKS